MIKKFQKKSAVHSRPPLARMLHLHEKLARGDYPNCQQAALDLEVSYKTIQRDIDFMRDQMRLPIAYDRARYGFYYTEKVTHFPAVQVTEGELVALLVAQKALAQYKGTGFEAPLRNAFEKLTEGLRDRVDFQVENMGGIFSFRTIGAPVSDLRLFETLGQCVLKNVEVEFEYRKLGSSGYEKRRAQPYHLACVDNQWYLFAYDVGRKSVRTFALPRIRTARATQTVFKRPSNFSPAKMLGQSFGIFSGTEKYGIKIWFDPYAAQLIREKQWHPSQKIRERRDGSAELSMTLNNLHEVRRWILSWENHARVLAPPELKKDIAQTLAAMRKNYAK